MPSGIFPMMRAVVGNTPGATVEPPEGAASSSCEWTAVARAMTATNRTRVGFI